MYQCQEFIHNFVDNMHTSNSKNESYKTAITRISFKDGSYAVITHDRKGYYKDAICYDPNGKVVRV